MRPNVETLAAMAEAERISRDPSVKGCRNMAAMFEELDADE
jgi:DNA-damage-inducible protein J